MRKVHLFFINVLILTASSILIQTITMSFNVFLTNKIGTEGIGLYYLILSIYGLAVTIANSGIYLTVTRLISEESAFKTSVSHSNILKRCLIYGLFFGLLSFSLLYFNAEFIGNAIFHDKRTINCIKILSLSMPFISMTNVFNGYFTAVRRVINNSAAQIFELLIKIISIVILLTFLLPKGVEYACIALFTGGVIGEICSFIFIVFLYIFDSKRIRLENTSNNKIIKKMFSIALPIAFSTYIRSSLNSVKQIIVPKGLQNSGLSYKKSLSNYGLINGMVMPVLCFPMNILYSCSNMLVPELSECNARGNKVQIKRIVKKALKTTFTFSVIVFALCVFFSDKLGLILYKNNESGHFIMILSPIILTMYIDAVTDGMLKGLNQQVCSMKYNIIDSAVSIILLIFLLPKYGINGYIAVIFVSEILNTTLSIRRLIKVVFKN